MSKQAGIRAIKSAASAGASELRRKGLHKAARGLAVVGGATASIGGHVEGWQGELGGMMRGAPLGRRRKKRRSSTGKKRKGHHKKATHHKRKGHRKAKSRKHRSPAQRAATRKMLAANKRRRRR